jgi:hypothetical protein
MADDENPQVAPGEEDEYELLPHKEIEDLKEELSKLKEFEIAPSKRLQVGLLELNTKLDKLITIFEDATHELRVEEGGLSFTEKMRPLLEKMNKILEQNSEIASGILALADMVKDLKEAHEEAPRPMPEQAPTPMEMAPPMPARPAGMMAPPRMPPGPIPPGVPPGMPLPPLPRKRTFGI